MNNDANPSRGLTNAGAPAKNVWRKRLGVALPPILLLGCYAAILWNTNDWGRTKPMLVFTSPWLNTLALCAGLLLPLPVLILILGKWRGAARAFGAILVGLLMPLSLLLIPLVYLFGSHARAPEGDAGFERLQKVPVGRYEAAVYRTNGGATTDFGIVVRQELSLVPGLRLVRVIYHQKHAFNATVEVLGPNTIRFTLNQSSETPEPKILHLHPMFSFTPSSRKASS